MTSTANLFRAAFAFALVFSLSACTDNAPAKSATKKTGTWAGPPKADSDSKASANPPVSARGNSSGFVSPGGAVPRPAMKSPAKVGRSIEELNRLEKKLELTTKQRATRKGAIEKSKDAESNLDNMLDGGKSPAEDVEKEAKKALEAVGKVAPSGNFPEAAHNSYEQLCEDIKGVNVALESFRKGKSLKLWMRARTSLIECRTSADELAEEYDGYPGIDDRIAELEKLEQSLNAEKPR
jgi:hypothetical protein